MAWLKKGNESEEPSDPNARLVTTEADQTKAGKWFIRARELGDKRQFDYAVEYYVNGLEFWPDAVEDACKALHGCAVARLQTGGKKAGLKDTMKRSLNDKDPRQAFVNALWLFGHDPDNLAFLEAIVKNAGRLRAEDAAKWAGGVYCKALESAPKASQKQIETLALLTEELGDRAAERDESTFALEAFQISIDTINLARRRKPKDHALEERVRNLSTKLTILKGKYQDGGSYRDSVVDNETQAELHDKDRSVQTDERLDELIATAKDRHTGDPEDDRLFKSYLDLLCRRERDDEELTAIGALVKRFKTTSNYRWKQLADDIRMKQLGRKGRALKASDPQAYKKHQIDRLRFELAVFKDRTERYPTDNRIKFQLATRLFRAGRFDDAIPVFQAARADPKSRAACGLYLGRCFLRKDYPAQAAETLAETLEQYETQEDDTGKELNYWLARAQEASGDAGKARKTYGKLLQTDYNFRDVRDRLERLPSGD